MKVSYKRVTVDVPLWAVRAMRRRMRWVRAAGGAVSDEASGRTLLIERNGRWDLPKGKVEPGESLREAALREVEEETGVRAACAPGRSLIAKTYHIYNLYGGWHLKQTSWFAMRAPEQPVRPQAEEGISGGEWVPPAEGRGRLRRSYGTMRLLSSRIWQR